MKYLILFLMSVFVLLAQTPQTFKNFADEYAKNQEQLAILKNHVYFKSHQQLFDTYTKSIENCFDVGYALDEAIKTKNGKCAVLKKKYLTSLRLLKNEKTDIEKIYVQALYYAMANDDIALFNLLITAPMHPLYTSRVKKKVLAYYKREQKLQGIALLDTLQMDMKLEVNSRRIAKSEIEVYEEQLSVIKAQEAKKLRLMTADKRTRNVIVSTQKFEGGYHFIAENLNAFEVTIELTLSQINNFEPSATLPLVVELKAGSKQSILDMTQIDKTKKAWFKSYFSWAMGSISAVHDDSYLYQLPFAKNSKVYISQGYHGAATHRGLSAYAIDFAVVEGTSVYAARSGKVVALHSSSNEGGFSKRFRSKANYIVIEHSDRTLGKYYHLKQYGVFVKVGDNVKQGDKIGLSGNTGYSSGPHLHFSVSKVDSKSHKRAQTIPTRFKAVERTFINASRGQTWSVL